jgi:hypothetical protein
MGATYQEFTFLLWHSAETIPQRQRKKKQLAQSAYPQKLTCIL